MFPFAIGEVCFATTCSNGKKTRPAKRMINSVVVEAMGKGSIGT
jgi:hypothetical protein